MWALIVCTLSIFGLIWLRLQIQRFIQAVVLLLGGKAKRGVYVYTLLFLPGIVLHELAHFLTAALLGVPTGEIHLLPQEIEPNTRVALGSVKVAKADFVREAIIGAAPFFFGCTSLFILVKIFFWPFEQIVNGLSINGGLFTMYGAIHLFIIYLIIAITNTMFLSSEDTHAFPGIVILFSILVMILYFTGTFSNFSSLVWPWAQKAGTALAGTLLFVVTVDGLLMVLLWAWIKLLQKITHKRVVFH